MIGYLRGVVIERRVLTDTAVELVVDVGGVGYRVLVTPRLASAIVVGVGEVALVVHTYVREGAITLYGFAGADERQSFELLIGAHGVGPALALAIISVHAPQRLAEVVTSGDVDALTLVPGVGKKTAARLVMELKARYDQVDVDGADLVRLAGTERTVSMDLTEALGQLGYGTDEVRAVVRSLPLEGTLEELLRQALRELAPRR